MKQGGSDEGAVNLEEAFFAGESARLLEDLRKKVDRNERRDALRKVVSIEDDQFLDRLIAMGIGAEQAMALRLIPLIFEAGVKSCFVAPANSFKKPVRLLVHSGAVHY